MSFERERARIDVACRAPSTQPVCDTAHSPRSVAETAEAAPYATAIIAGAAVASAGEALLPGAAAFVLATQVGAIASLTHLYTGKWLARSQALAVVPALAGEAAGGSVFLFAKSFLPPTGLVDGAAAVIAASMTISVLGAVAWALQQGHSLEEKHKLKL